MGMEKIIFVRSNIKNYTQKNEWSLIYIHSGAWAMKDGIGVLRGG